MMTYEYSPAETISYKPASALQTAQAYEMIQLPAISGFLTNKT
jgi:hypothetical protein